MEVDAEEKGNASLQEKQLQADVQTSVITYLWKVSVIENVGGAGAGAGAGNETAGEAGAKTGAGAGAGAGPEEREVEGEEPIRGLKQAAPVNE